MKDKFKIYISYDPADRDKADEVEQFLLKNGIMLQCDKNRYENLAENRIKLWAVKAIRQCDLFICLVSTATIDENGKIKNPLGQESVEALSFNRDRLFLFLESRGNFTHLLQELSKSTKNSYLVFPESSNRSINYQKFMEILKETGFPLLRNIDKNSPDDTSRNYDVFISFKSEDHLYAQSIYDFLKERGLKVFFSKSTLPVLGSDDYHKQIDMAIDNTKHMVVVTSSASNITSKWVEYEWRLFLNEKLNGRKSGNLVTVLADGFQVRDLPISLRNREAIPLVPGEIGRLLEYVSIRG